MTNAPENRLANLQENIADLVQRRVNVQGLDGTEPQNQPRAHRQVVKEHVQGLQPHLDLTRPFHQ